MKKVLVLGGKGMAGHLLVKYLNQLNKYQVAQVARGITETKESYSIDVTNKVELDNLLAAFAPDIIINCVGILNKDAEDNPDKAIFINSYLPHYLARKVGEYDGRLIHISTDCVFSGKKGDYTELDSKDGIGFYAQSKALGEVDYDKHVTIRTSIIGPELNKNGIGLLHWFLTNTSQIFKGYNNAFWSGVTTLQLSHAVAHAIDDTEICGVIHLTNGIKISKYDLLVLFNKIFNANKTIESYPDYYVDKSLLAGPLSNRLGYVPSYVQMLKELKLWMSNNSDLYKDNYSF